MENDSLLITVGLLLTLHGIVMLAIYLFREKGSLFDPIPICWAGYIVFIGIGPLATGILIPQRGSSEVAGYAMFLYVLTGIMFTVGLYAGGGGRLSRLLPVPTPFLSAAQVWFMLVFCAVLVGVCWPLAQFAPAGVDRIVGALVDASTGAIALVSIFVLLSYKGHLGIKFLSVGALVATLMFILRFYFSRRPVLAIFVTAAALFYYLKVSWWRPAVRKLFMASIIVGGVSVLMYLQATRGARVREYYTGPSKGVFSKENWEELLGGVTINTQVYEYTVQQFPEYKPYLYGSGMAPAFVFFIPRAFWPGKPMPTGGVVSRLWFNVSEHVVSVTPTFPGELYANFGFLGILFGMFLTGKIVRALNTYLLSNHDNLVAHMAWFIIIPDFASEWRGDFTSMSIQGFLRVVMFFFLAWLAGKMASSGQYEMDFDMDLPGADYSEDESSIYNEQR
jgi:oligosaccharide repeat unit polymerase